MANKKLTFADRATLIINKYKKYEGDPIAEKTMEIELQELAREQEAKKQEMGITEGQEEMAYGGKMKKSFGGPETDLAKGKFNFPLPDTSVMTKITPKKGIIDRPVNPSLIKPSADVLNQNDEKSGDISSPTKVGYQGMAASAGNLYSLIDGLATGPQTEKYERATPNFIDGTQRKRDARETINTAANNVGASIREGSLSSGARIGATIGNEANRSRQINSALNQIQESVDNSNAQIGNQFEQLNTGIANQEMVANAQNEAAFKDRIASDMNTIGGAYGSRSAEQRKAEATHTMNTRIINAINSGQFSDYFMDMMLQINAKTPKTS